MSLDRPAQAIVLAAGRGERMRPLTDTCPKPLLPVRGKPLIAWHLEAFARAGLTEVVINTAWLEEQFPAALGDGKRWGVRLRYSTEGHDFGAALETAGGIARALPMLAPRFWVIAGDVWCPDFHPGEPAAQASLDAGRLAHIGLVANPPHNEAGDFGLSEDGRALNLTSGSSTARLTYSTFGLYTRSLFEPPWCDIEAGNPQGIKAPLAPVLRRAMDQGRVGAWQHRGAWTDVGTVQRLAQLNEQEAAT